MSGNYSSYKKANSTPKKTASQGRKKPVTNKEVEKSSSIRNSNRGDSLQTKSKKESKGARKTKRQRHKEVKQRDKANKKLQKENRKLRRKSFLKKVKPVQITILFLAIYLVFAANIIVDNNSKLAQLKYKVTELNTEITRQGNIINELEAKRESTFKSQTIENYAKYKLDMVYPTKEQIVYIKVG